MKLNQTFTDLITQNLRLGQIPILLGKAGIGKTSVLRSAAKQIEAESFTLAVNLLADKADLTGARLIQDETGEYKQSFFPHEDIAEAVDFAEANPDRIAVITLDEINRTSGDVTSGILGVCTDRKVGRRRLPGNLYIAATGNDKGNVAAFDEASISRFVVYYVQADAQGFMDFMGDQLNDWIREVLESDNDLIGGDSTPNSIAADQDGDAGDDIQAQYGDPFADDDTSQITTPRTLEYLSDWLNDSSHDQLAIHLATPAVIDDRKLTELDEIVQGFVGNTAFANQLVGVMGRDLGGVQSTASISRPTSYDGLRQARTMTDRLRTINAMSDDERADALVYALADTEDSSGFINLLAENVNDLGAERNRQLLEMANTQRLDTENVKAFLESGTDLGEYYESYLGSFI